MVIQHKNMFFGKIYFLHIRLRNHLHIYPGSLEQPMYPVERSGFYDGNYVNMCQTLILYLDILNHQNTLSLFNTEMLDQQNQDKRARKSK